MIKRNLILLILVVGLFGCARNPEREEESLPSFPSEISVPIVPNGEIIDILAPEGWNTFKIGELVSLMVQNLSGDPITFEHDLGAKIYLLQNNTWLRVEDKVVDSDTDKIILEPNEIFDPLKIYTLVLLPDISESEDKVTLRIFVIGNIHQDEQTGDRQIATYIDLQLDP